MLPASPTSRGEVEPRAGASFGTFISKIHGSYSLQAPDGSCLKGNYTFEEATGKVMDHDIGEVGTFSCEPIASSELRFSTPGDIDMACIAIQDSEVMAEIQSPDNEDAYFVLPSQLNGAEYPNHDSVVEFIEDYKYDNTGGPRGQLAVHPAAGQFILDNAAHDGREEGINAVDVILEKMREAKLVFELQNGYLKMPNPKSQRDADRALEVFKAHLHTLRPLMMSAVPACGLTPNKRRFSEKKHTVNLVYASAVPVQSYVNMAGNPEVEAFHIQIAEAVLCAQYYGALVQTAQKTLSDGDDQRPRIFLMPLGGGVFNNPWESIARGMSCAVEMLTSIERETLDIRALTWSGNPNEGRQLRELLTKFGKLRK